MKSNNGYLRINVEGHVYPEVKVGLGIHSCGKIIDGISLEFGKEGSWVISFKDLEDIYNLASTFRI